MVDGFQKLKRKTLKEAVLKSVVLGASAGLFVVGVLLLAFRLASVDFHWAYYIPIGVGAFALAGGIFFLASRPTDRSVARKYDAEFGLNEKLQTMVAFAGRDGDIVALQRQDALERLESMPPVKVKFSRIWYYTLIAALAIALFFSGLFVPAAVNATDPSEPIGGGDKPGIDVPIDENAFEYTLVMQGNMDDLINSVRGASALTDEIRLYMIDRLEELDARLLEIKKKDEMAAAVYAAVSDVDELIVRTNSFEILSAEFSGTDERLADSVTQGFISYKGALADNMRESYLYRLGTEIGNDIQSAMEPHVKAAVDRLKVSQISLDGLPALGVVLGDYIASMEGALADSAVADTDALYNCFLTLKNGLTPIRRQVGNGGTGDSVIWGRMDDVYGIYTRNAVSALTEQNYKCIAEVFVRQGLSRMFDISFGELPELYADIEYVPGSGGGSGGDGSGGNGPGSGGAGPGDVVFGSDDLIYYPTTGEYVKFGDVLKEYEDAIVNGTLAEDFPAELAKYLEAYLNYLHNGTGSANGTEN